MGEVKQINIKNWTYCFYNDKINVKNFEPNLLKIDRKSNNTGYITIKKIDDYENVYSVNPFYLFVNHVNRYIEEKGVNKYLIFDSMDKKKELLGKYNDIWNGIKNKTEELSMIMKKCVIMKKSVIMKKITLKLNFILTMTCH